MTNDDTLHADTKGRPVAFCGFGKARLRFNSGTFRRPAQITFLISSHNISSMHVTIIVSHFGNFRSWSERIVGAWRRQYCCSDGLVAGLSTWLLTDYMQCNLCNMLTVAQLLNQSKNCPCNTESESSQRPPIGFQPSKSTLHTIHFLKRGTEDSYEKSVNPRRTFQINNLYLCRN